MQCTVYYVSSQRRFVCLILNLALKVFFRLVLYSISDMPARPLLSKQSAMWIYSPPLSSLSLVPPLAMLKLQDAVLCRCATEAAREIYWPRVPPFDTQDVANRSYAISHLLRLPCKADLSCLRAIFKL